MVVAVTAGKSTYNTDVDSVLGGATDAVMCADLLNQEAWKVRNDHPDASVRFAEKALEFATQIQYKQAIAKAHNTKGIAHFNLSQYENALTEAKNSLELYRALDDKQSEGRTSMILAGILFRLGRYDGALEHLGTALNIKEEENDKQGIASVLLNISNAYQAIGQFDIALENLLKALSIQEELNDSYGIAITANNIGGIYFKLGHIETALGYLEQALSWFRGGGSLFDISKTLCNIGHMYGQQKNYDKALEYQSEALSIARSIDDQQNIAATISSMGRIYFQTNETATALSYHATALKIMRDIGDKHGELESLRYIGDIYQYKHENKRALKYYVCGIDLAQQINASNEEATLHDCCSRAYESLKEYERSLFHFKRAADIRNEILASDKQKLIAVMEIRFNIERTSREREIYRLRNVELAEAITALQEKTTALASAYEDLENQQEITNAINSELENANTQLQELNNEKNELLGIVTHDVKNLVAGIKLAAEGIRRYKLTKDDKLMQTTTERILNAATNITTLITGLLDTNAIETGMISYNLQPTDVETTVLEVMEHYETMLEHKELKAFFSCTHSMQAHVDPDRFREALDNIYSNAVKYSPKGKHIHVHITTNAGFAEISVQDQGQGFTEEDLLHVFKKFKKLSARPTGGEHSSGLGLSIAKKLIQQMGGEIELQSSAGNGARFTIKVLLSNRTTQQNIHS